MVGGEHTGVGGGFDRVAVRAGEVRVVARFKHFVTDDGVPDAHLDVQAVADRGFEIDISLLDSEVGSRSKAAGLRTKGVRIRAEQGIDFVAGTPGISRIRRLFEAELDDVQVEPVRLARSAEGVAGVVGVAGAKVPLGRRVNVSAQRRGRERGHD